MKLKAVYDTEAEIGSEYLPLYTKSGDKYHFTGLDGLKTQADIDRLTGSLEKERNDHKSLRRRVAPLIDGAYDINEVMIKLDKYDELETAAAGNNDPEQLQKLVDAKLRTTLAPLERERDTLLGKVSELEGDISRHEEKDRLTTISTGVRKAASLAKIADTAYDDVLLLAEKAFEVTEDNQVLTKEGSGVTPGISPDVWLVEMQEKRPHWWPASRGNGAPGSTHLGLAGSNPWLKDHWNLTEQGRIVQSKGLEKAEQLAKQAGSSVGASGPVN